MHRSWKKQDVMLSVKTVCSSSDRHRKEVTAYDWWYASLYSNLGKYNEGELVGDWFSFPLDEEVIAERIGLNAEYEEYAIHDTDNFPMEISE